MKKKILGGLAVLAIAALAAWNLNFSSKAEGIMSDVMLANVEALAENESNPWYLWPFQGTTKDEYPESKPCTEGINLIFWYVEWEGTRIICHDGGSENCSTQICSE